MSLPTDVFIDILSCFNRQQLSHLQPITSLFRQLITNHFHTRPLLLHSTLNKNSLQLFAGTKKELQQYQEEEDHPDSWFAPKSQFPICLGDVKSPFPHYLRFDKCCLYYCQIVDVKILECLSPLCDVTLRRTFDYEEREAALKIMYGQLNQDGQKDAQFWQTIKNILHPGSGYPLYFGSTFYISPLKKFSSRMSNEMFWYIFTNIAFDTAIDMLFTSLPPPPPGMQSILELPAMQMIERLDMHYSGLMLNPLLAEVPYSTIPISSIVQWIILPSQLHKIAELQGRFLRMPIYIVGGVGAINGLLDQLLEQLREAFLQLSDPIANTRRISLFDFYPLLENEMSLRQLPIEARTQANKHGDVLKWKYDQFSFIIAMLPKRKSNSWNDDANY